MLARASGSPPVAAFAVHLPQVGHLPDPVQNTCGCFVLYFGGLELLCLGRQLQTGAPYVSEAADLPWFVLCGCMPESEHLRLARHRPASLPRPAPPRPMPAAPPAASHPAPLRPADPTFNAAAAMCKIVNAAPATDLGVVEGMAQAIIVAEYEVCC